MSNTKVFLGGTCNGSKWRDLLIPELTVEYFDPVVEDWTPDMIEIEETEKESSGTHLYYITVKMKGVYSIAEVVESVFDKTKNTVFCVATYGFNDAQKRSLAAVSELIERNGGTVLTNVNITELAAVLNTIEPKDEDSTLDPTITVNTEVDNSGFQPTLRSMSPDGTDVLEEEWIVTETINGIMKQNIYRKVYKV